MSRASTGSLSGGRAVTAIRLLFCQDWAMPLSMQEIGFTCALMAVLKYALKLQRNYKD
jgi:hypothetical protein